jgi:hypothetical protein
VTAVPIHMALPLVMVKAVTRAEVRWWWGYMPLVWFAPATHRERASVRLDAQVGWRSKCLVGFLHTFLAFSHPLIALLRSSSSRQSRSTTSGDQTGHTSSQLPDPPLNHFTAPSSSCSTNLGDRSSRPSSPPLESSNCTSTTACGRSRVRTRCAWAWSW